MQEGVEVACHAPAPTEPASPPAEQPAANEDAFLAAAAQRARQTSAHGRGTCLATLLEQGDAPLPSSSLDTARLAQLASSDRFAAHWASWCDTMPVIQARRPRPPKPKHTCVTLGTRHRIDWAVICSGAAAPPAPDQTDDPWPLKGWQRSAARACDERAYETHLSHLTSASCALLLSQAGPFASRALNPPAPPAIMSPSPVRSSGSCCCGACDCPSPSHRADAAATGYSTLSVTIARPVPPLAFCPLARCLSSTPSRVFAVKLVPEWHATSGSRT